MISVFDKLMSLINGKQDKKIISVYMQRNSYYLIAKAPLNSNYARISIFVDNATDYNNLAPTIFNVGNSNNMDRFKLYETGENSSYLTKLAIYRDSEYKYLVLSTANYCDYVTAELISQYNYTLLNTKMTREEYDEFRANKTLVGTV